MAKIVQLGKTHPTIEPELKEFIDACLVPVLVRNALKEIQSEKSNRDLESTALPQVRCANGGTR
jgi:hypothetical protein